jgi:hypothetical protein
VSSPLLVIVTGSTCDSSPGYVDELNCIVVTPGETLGIGLGVGVAGVGVGDMAGDGVAHGTPARSSV